MWTKDQQIPISLCDCCAVALANGDDSGCRVFWEHKDGADEHPDGALGRLEGYRACVTGEGSYFSTGTCDGCGTRLHGDRIDGVIVDKI